MEELLELRESILEQKKNLTYYIEQSDSDDSENDALNSASSDSDEKDNPEAPQDEAFTH